MLKLIVLFGLISVYTVSAAQTYKNEIDLSNNIFLKHMISSRAAGFEGPQYLPPKCERNEYCVSKSLCVNGYFTGSLSNQKETCEVTSDEICCKFRQPTQPPTSPPVTRPPPTQPPRTPCPDENYDCVLRNQCVNGEIKNIYAKTSNSCDAGSEVCCRFPTMTLNKDGYHLRVPSNGLTLPPRIPAPTPTTYTPPKVPSYIPPAINEIPESSNIKISKVQPAKPERGEYELSLPIDKKPTATNVISTSSQSQGSFLAIPLPTACAAAMNCTDIQFCTSTGFISKSPVVLSPAEELYRVPLSDCRDPSKGLDAGKCCRDPDYVDPWPSSTERNRIVRGGENARPVRGNIATGSCCTKTAQRKFNTEPRAESEIDANFKEFSWQIMVLKDATKTLLCGASLICDNIILTSASCVKNQKPYDTVLKAGEWKLGSDIEPLKFQISRASKIVLHPQFNSVTGENDLALVYTEQSFKYGGNVDHISPICIDNSDISPGEKCVTLGWGEQALKYHLQDAVMHYSNIYTSDSLEANTPTHHILATEIDGSQIDPGSALACTKDDVNYHLKGVYTKNRGNIIEFTRPNMDWVNAALSTQTRKSSTANFLNNFIG